MVWSEDERPRNLWLMNLVNLLCKKLCKRKIKTFLTGGFCGFCVHLCACFDLFLLMFTNIEIQVGGFCDGVFCSPVRISARRATATITSKLPLTVMVGSFHQWYLFFFFSDLCAFILMHFLFICQISMIWDIYWRCHSNLLHDVNHYKVKTCSFEFWPQFGLGLNIQQVKLICCYSNFADDSDWKLDNVNFKMDICVLKLIHIIKRLQSYIFSLSIFHNDIRWLCLCWSIWRDNLLRGVQKISINVYRLNWSHQNNGSTFYFEHSDISIDDSDSESEHSDISISIFFDNSLRCLMKEQY